MLRAILAFCLLAFVGGLAFYAGRSSAPTSVAVIPAPPEIVAIVPEQVRARTDAPPAADPPLEAAQPVTPVLPEPPVVAANRELKAPELPNAVEGQAPGDSSALDAKGLGLPIANLKKADIHDTFLQARAGGERRHEATDIMAPTGTPVVAVDTGIVAKLFTSVPGGLTVYQFDPSQKYAYYYAHLDRYAEGLREGMLLKKGDRLGYVGATGNADPKAPHLHFAVFELGPEKHWWEGRPINPYSLLLKAMGK